MDLPAGVQTNLQSMMSDAARMVPHEWYAHGTCSGLAPAVYFSNAVTLTDQVSKILNPVFEKAANGTLSLSAVRDRIDAEFGEEAGKRVGLTCRDVDGAEIVVYEVHLSLPPVAELGGAENTAEKTLSPGDLLTKAPTIFAGCRRGEVP